MGRAISIEILSYATDRQPLFPPFKSRWTTKKEKKRERATPTVTRTTLRFAKTFSGRIWNLTLWRLTLPNKYEKQRKTHLNVQVFFFNRFFPVILHARRTKRTHIYTFPTVEVGTPNENKPTSKSGYTFSFRLCRNGRLGIVHQYVLFGTRPVKPSRCA